LPGEQRINPKLGLHVDSPLERAQGVALWRQIEQHLLNDIEAKRLSPGMRLPNETDLAARFGVNRHTVRHAIAALEEKGVFLVRQGLGTFIHEHVVEYAVGRRTRFSENLARSNVEARSEVLHSGIEPADAKSARVLELRSGQPMIRIQTLRMANGRPLSLSVHCFSAKRFPSIAGRIEQFGSVTRALKAEGVQDYLRKETRIFAAMPDVQEALLLRQPRNRPILIAESVNVDEAGTPIEFGVARFSADRIQLILNTP
jgi:GntR family transcriptional regulator, phosphonate transport system regulatory protein